MILINEKQIQKELNNLKVIVLNSCTSTNDLLKDDKYTEETLLITEEQTNGIGRIGRTFISNKNKGIYMSLLTYKKIPLDVITLVTQVTSVVVSRCIEKYIDKQIKIKWVNDLYLDDYKISGILVQSKIKDNTLDKLIIGIGINIYNQDFDEELSKKASSIETLTNIKIDRNSLIIDIIQELNKALTNIYDLSYMKEYIKRSNLINKEVLLLLKAQEVKAKVLDITLNGELKVLIDNQEYLLSSAEVLKIYL